jgi:hypothetical protein
MEFAEFDKENYKFIKAESKTRGIRLAYKESNSPNYNAVAVAYRPTLQSNKGKYVEVAVAYCSKHDSPKKKVGKCLAAQRFKNCRTVVLPLGPLSDDEHLSKEERIDIDNYILNVFEH